MQMRSCTCYKKLTPKLRKNVFGGVSGQVIFFQLWRYQFRGGGVAILFKHKRKFGIGQLHRDQNGRYLCLEIDTGDNIIVIDNIYAPNDDQPNFYSEISEMFDQLSSPHRILAGDFNLALDVEKDKRGTTFNNVQATEMLLAYMTEKYRIDICWRA